jgi:hypothetical protein
MLQAESIDLATNIGVAALAQTQGIGTDVAEIKADVAKTTADLTQYQTTVQNHLQRLEDGLGELNEDAKNANIKMNVLQTAVQGNTVVIQSLATISYSGWTTAQKLQAVQSGLFPDLTGPSKDAVIESLKSQQSVEVAASALSAASQGFGNLAQIAGNVGLPRDVVAGLQGAQVVAGSIARFATGDYLGAVAGLTSLVGLGGPDANAQRYAAMMSYLQQSFAQVNAKLDKVIDLQVKTLTAIAQLAKAQDDFRRKALGKLDEIETIVLQNQQILQDIVLNRWADCHALVYGNTTLNGQFIIPDHDALVALIGDGNLPPFAAGCYRTLSRFLEANVKPASWAGDIIAADIFPTLDVSGDTNLQKALKVFQAQKTNAFGSARDFFVRFQRDPHTSRPLAFLAARLAQPVADVKSANQLNLALSEPDVAERLRGFKCNDTVVLSPPLVDLLCEVDPENETAG